MWYQLNLWFKTFGFNKTANMSLILDDEKQVEIFLNGYKPLIENYQLFKKECETIGNTHITKRTQIH